jgi:hypothetical protein
VTQDLKVLLVQTPQFLDQLVHKEILVHRVTLDQQVLLERMELMVQMVQQQP